MPRAGQGVKPVPVGDTGYVPELPEVETLRHGLEGTIRGKRITAVNVLWPGTFDLPQAILDTEVAGHRITAVRRRGKVLLLDLDRDWHLLLHPKMTGQLVVCDQGQTVFAGGHPSPSLLGAMPNPTTRVVFTLNHRATMYFNDQRKFGWIRLADTPALATDPFLSRLGPEPLSDAFTPSVLRERLGRHQRAPIKAALLDQSTLAGIGNIYADECLHLARLHPRRLAGTLTAGEVTRLHHAIQTILGNAIEHGGTSFAEYINQARGHDTYLAHARVFHRDGRPCPTCGTPIERIRVAGRGTNLCPRCQPYPTPAAEPSARTGRRHAESDVSAVRHPTAAGRAEKPT